MKRPNDSAGYNTARYIEHLEESLKKIRDIDQTVDWKNVESAKYMQASLYHQMRNMAKEALE